MRGGAQGGRLPWAVMLTGMLAIVLGGAPAYAQKGIPAHPDRLRFDEIPFAVPDPEGVRHELPNGVPVYVVEDDTLPLVNVAVVVRGGSALDPPEKVGLASLTAALMRRGGAGDLSSQAFDVEADRLALELDASAGTLRAGVSLNAPAWELEPALDLLFRMLRRPRFDRQALERARENLLDSMARRGDDPLAVLDREWTFLLYGKDHPASRLLTPSSLGAVTREDLVSFHRAHWHPGGMVLAVSGRVETEALLAGLARRFKDWQREDWQREGWQREGWEGQGREAGETAPLPAPRSMGDDPASTPPAPQNLAPRPGLYHVERDIPQAKVALGHLGSVRSGWDDPEFYHLAVAEQVLAGRLGARLRSAEGLAYRAGATIGVGDEWPGLFRVFLETRNPSVAPALDIARQEIERLRREAIHPVELDLAQRSLTRVFPLLFDSAEEIAGYFAEDEFLGRPHAFWTAYRSRVEAVTAADVRRAAERRLDPEGLVILTVGRWKEIERGDGDRKVSMDDFHDGLVQHLPERDPRTLEFFGKLPGELQGAEPPSAGSTPVGSGTTENR